jgi:hypothetical protein
MKDNLEEKVTLEIVAIVVKRGSKAKSARGARAKKVPKVSRVTVGAKASREA